MDYCIHTLSGAAAASCAVAAFGTTRRHTTGILLLGAAAGMIPDIDSISMTAPFRQYAPADPALMPPWFMHRMFFHSLAFLILLSAAAFLVALRLRLHKDRSAKSGLRLPWEYPAAIVPAFLVHVALDVPTPLFRGRGLGFWWPFDRLIGGTGQVFWFNNYDILLILAGVCAASFLLVYLTRISRAVRLPAIAILLVLGGILCILQVNSREFNFNTPGVDKERISLEIQRKILGGTLYGIMARIDRALTLGRMQV